MKLVNQQTTIPLPNDSDADHKATFADLIRVVVDGKSMKEGCSISEMRLRLGIVEQCEEQPEVMGFTAERWAFIKTTVQAHKWGMHHKDLLVFADAIEAASDFKEPLAES